MSTLETRLTKIDKAKDYLLDKIKHMLNYVKHLLILVSTVTVMFQFLHLVH